MDSKGVPTLNTSCQEYPNPSNQAAAAQGSRHGPANVPVGLSDAEPVSVNESGFSSENPYEPLTNASAAYPHHHHLTKKIFGYSEELDQISPVQRPSVRRRRASRSASMSSGAYPMADNQQIQSEHKQINGTKPGAMPRPVAGVEKLGTFSGVFVPTSLNVLSILMFLRFGFILGQGGFLGMMGMLVASYIINLITTFSISAIASNGTVRGGGAYYLISRSLGPEFGGSIGIVFYLGFVLNTGMNAVGLIDCLNQNFGLKSGNWAHIIPEGFWWQYLWSTCVLTICTAVCLAGSGVFARASNGLLVLLLVATFSIPISALVVKPFEDRQLGVEFTGPRRATFMGNLFPQFTRGAVGSILRSKETYQDLFGILFPATGGIFAGASMSGDLKHPSKAIPKGTLAGLALTFFVYTLVIISMASSITRSSFYRNLNVIQDVRTNISGILILLGEFATTFFSALMGVIGSAKLLQALARDNILPGFFIFGQGTAIGDEPTYAILITHVVAQITMLCDINQIASFVTMTYLMTFLVTNLACFLLKVGSAPNFRPRFRFFNSWTALIGTVVSGATMFFVDGFYATGCVGILVVIFLIIHYTTPPKSWGDVSQSLIYHQVRKYLLRLRPEHVKFWRPQILLFINDPRRQYKLIQFCNSMKKGALFILGHVIVTQDFAGSVPEARRQQAAWTKYIDFSRVKAFVNISISPAVEWGTRNIILCAGLGGMRPNIAVLGFYNLDQYRMNQPLIDITPIDPTEELSASPRVMHRARRSSKDAKLDGLLPTDTCRVEGAMSITSYVTILEDMLLRLQINVALAKGFNDLEFPNGSEQNGKRFIDLWPIQMSAEIAGESDNRGNVLTTNFDTYTLILQLGVILDTVPAWKKAYKLRVIVFVEYESDVEEERGRVKTLLDNLRIPAEILVFWLASGHQKAYEWIINGTNKSNDAEIKAKVEDALHDEEWWQGLQEARKGPQGSSPGKELSTLVHHTSDRPMTSQEQVGGLHSGLRKLMRKSKRRSTISGLLNLGVSMGMRTHRLSPYLVRKHASHASASEPSDSESNDVEGDDVFFSDDDSTQQGESVSGSDEASLEDFEPPTKQKISINPPNLGPFGNGLDQAHSTFRQILDPGPSTTPARLHVSGSTTEPTPRSTAPGQPSPKAMLPEQPLIKPVSSTSKPAQPSRPPIKRISSMPKFSSRPVPPTKVATEDGPGPSIMFAETPSPPKKQANRLPSAYERDEDAMASNSSEPFHAATGFPFQQAVPLSFNELPCRAQHIILNELIRENSNETAVLFTTLPSPLEGTCASEEASFSYLSDLELLCRDLPPVLLIHSNSMTVTMNL
ncbi:MAG: hypothetical protein M1829_006436 [Trizodia sp. TS-e1964]|nr:MAG: hypothetical protein M1829_006436 [Trizodia sp. TS-e1964]